MAKKQDQLSGSRLSRETLTSPDKNGSECENLGWTRGDLKCITAKELFCFSEMPFEIHSLVQDADNQDAALRAKCIEDYVMSAMESVQVGHNLLILF